MDKFLFLMLFLISLLAIFIPVILVLHWKYKSTLTKLLISLPNEKKIEFQNTYRKEILNSRNSISDLIKVEFKESRSLTDLITTKKYISPDSEFYRRNCEMWFRRYKLAFRIVIPILMFLVLSAFAIHLWYLQ